MFLVDFDLSAADAYAQRMGAAADQVPFALSRALNDAVEAARQHIIKETWPSSGLTVRNQSFIGRAFSREGLVRSTKHDLQAEIRDTLHRGSLMLHAVGGTKIGRGNLAIPNVKGGSITRTSTGAVRSDQRPTRLRNTFRKGNKIYQRIDGPARYVYTGANKPLKRKSGVKLMYVLAPSAKIKPQVPFYEDFARVTSGILEQQIPLRVIEAMATRRPKA
jgi:hypothetical protein